MLEWLPDHLGVHTVVVVIAVLILWKAADWFVEGAVGVAFYLRVPPMLVGIVLVSLATTTPEVMASVLAALRDIPEVALGNAIGSVMVDASVALGLGALLAAEPLRAHPAIFRMGAAFLLTVIAVCFTFAYNGELARWEGAVLIAMFATYAAVSYLRARRQRDVPTMDEVPEEVKEAIGEEAVKPENLRLGRILVLFVGGFIGVLIGADFLLHGGKGIAEAFGLSPVVIGLTVVAVGTSVPEIATVVTSSLKGHSGLGVGNVIGADILNICWVAGLSAVANPLRAEQGVLLIMFPAMLITVVVMLSMVLFGGYRLRRWNGAVLLSLYVIYVVVLLTFAPRSVAV